MMAFYYQHDYGYSMQPENRQTMPFYLSDQRTLPLMVPSTTDYSYYGSAIPYTNNSSESSHSSISISPPNQVANIISPQREVDEGNYRNSNTNTNEFSIDYSSLINCTISPSIKRKRRNSGKTVKTPIDPNQTFPCTQCDKVFKKPYNLKSHMRTHSTEKPYTCSHCDRKFARSHDKKRHEELHGGVKNFKCEGYLEDGVTKWGCGKKFARSDALSRHFRTETGWLCIKPLMDEAKNAERKNSPTSHLHQQPQVPYQQAYQQLPAQNLQLPTSTSINLQQLNSGVAPHFFSQPRIAPQISNTQYPQKISNYEYY